MNLAIIAVVACLELAVAPPKDGIGQVTEFVCRQRADDALVSLDVVGLNLLDFTRIISCLTGERFLFVASGLGQVQVLATDEMTVADIRAAFLLAIETVGLSLVRGGKFTRIVDTSRIQGRTPIIEDKYRTGWVTEFIEVPDGATTSIRQLARMVVGPEAEVSIDKSGRTLVVSGRVGSIRRLKRILRNQSTLKGAWGVAVPMLPSHLTAEDAATLVRKLSPHLSSPVDTVVVSHGRRLVLVGQQSETARLG
ncbi:MAG: hypothetical protein VX223_05870, partial [Myxococcota bacterium]|nr:hypothetical protein [Myxococcota bacterium]